MASLDRDGKVTISKVHVTLIAFETLKPLDGVDAFVSARRKSPAQIVKEVGAAYQATSTKTPSPRMSSAD
ncbi:hypothetical protein APSETT445_005652 [Aspergillus pseudonomiae]